MVVLDTNVISELMRPEPNAMVLAWVKAQPRSQLYTTNINQAEILYGVAELPEGRRRAALTAVTEGIFAEEFAGRILPFGASATARYPDIVVMRRRVGRPIDGFDALIAATALAAGASVVTRDIGGFEGCGLTLINPWELS
jgi:predicted nucleic acid-binding protein